MHKKNPYKKDHKCTILPILTFTCKVLSATISAALLLSIKYVFHSGFIQEKVFEYFPLLTDSLSCSRSSSLAVLLQHMTSPSRTLN